MSEPRSAFLHIFDPRVPSMYEQGVRSFLPTYCGRYFPVNSPAILGNEGARGETCEPCILRRALWLGHITDMLI
jgi:hypothetical protein